jgi:hypothetical protein
MLFFSPPMVPNTFTTPNWQARALD